MSKDSNNYVRELERIGQKMAERKDKENYYLDIAETVLIRSTCLRRKYGAIIVLNDEIVATGYNGAPRNRQNCLDMEICNRDALKIPSGERYELCRSVHAEANAIISAARKDMIGATLYLSGRDAQTNELLDEKMNTPCSMCRRFIINAGIIKTVCRISETEHKVTNTRDWVYNDDSIMNVT
jgi:dCMP deaminase